MGWSSEPTHRVDFSLRPWLISLPSPCWTHDAPSARPEHKLSLSCAQSRATVSFCYFQLWTSDFCRSRSLSRRLPIQPVSILCPIGENLCEPLCSTSSTSLISIRSVYSPRMRKKNQCSPAAAVNGRVGSHRHLAHYYSYWINRSIELGVKKNYLLKNILDIILRSTECIQTREINQITKFACRRCKVLQKNTMNVFVYVIIYFYFCQVSRYLFSACSNYKLNIRNFLNNWPSTLFSFCLEPVARIYFA